MNNCILVCGGRKFDDERYLFEELDNLRQTRGFNFVVEGGASGADRLAYEWAKARQIPAVSHFANWAVLGNRAGPIRNKEMLEWWDPNIVVAFPGGRGTQNMIEQARARNIEVIQC